MNKSILLCSVMILTAAMPRVSSADDGWSLSKLNPFRKKSATEERARATVSDEAPKRFQMPRVSMPSWGKTEPVPAKRPEPSTWDKLSQSTKDAYAKTKNTLFGWTKKNSTSRASSDKRSFMTSWLPEAEPEKQKPKTVKDFLAQPRPGY